MTDQNRTGTGNKTKRQSACPENQFHSKKRAAYSVLLVLAALTAFLVYSRHSSSAGNAGLSYSSFPGGSSPEPIQATGFYFDTAVSVTIYDSQDEQLLEDCMELCASFETLFSRTLPESEIYRLNHGTLQDSRGVASLSPDTASLVAAGLSYSALSEGAFDITIAPLSSQWDFTANKKTVPSAKDLAEALPLVNYQNISLQGNRLRFLKPGMQLDLGAIAKGYIADRLKAYLLSQGVRSAIINLGGNVLCVGTKPDGSPFLVGIQNPFGKRGEQVAVAALSDCSVVSSGVYERYFEQDGTLYHHILNPRTGYPYENDLLSVTIFSPASTDGDALSTVCFSLGLEKGMALIDSLPDTYGIFITADETLHYSRGLTDAFQITRR